MKGAITNAKDVSLFATPGTLPNMSDAMTDYFQPMVFVQIVKSVENFLSVETPTKILFEGVMQPLTEQQLRMKPEGQRKWEWFWLHAEPGLSLNPDEEVFWQNVKYRVMARKNYFQYGYIEYHLVDDFSMNGRGP